MRQWLIPMALGLAALSCASCSEPVKGVGNPDLFRIGHRGAPEVAAENTIEAFKAALEVGADAVELDLCVTADGQIVVWHDRDPDDEVAIARQLGTEGLAYVPVAPPPGSDDRRPVEELTLDQLREHYGYAPPLGDRDPEAKIPTLDEVFAWAGEEPKLRALYLDVKLAPEQTREAEIIVDQAWSALNAAATMSQVKLFFLSVEKPIVESMKGRLGAGATNARVVWDFEERGALAGARELGLRDTSTGLTLTRSWSDFEGEVAELMYARKMGELDSVTVWTLNDDGDMREMLHLGVDGIMTDVPEELLAIRQKMLSGQ